MLYFFNVESVIKQNCMNFAFPKRRKLQTYETRKQGMACMFINN